MDQAVDLASRQAEHFTQFAGKRALLEGGKHA